MNIRTLDGTSKFLIFPEFPIIRTFVNSNKKFRSSVFELMDDDHDVREI